MQILYLGKDCSKITDFLKKNNEVYIWQDKLDLLFDKIDEFDFIISYGYRYIIAEEIVDKFKERAINLHISFLPWNRGSDPNLWSVLEDTPKGVTIHYIAIGLDKGDIIIQKEIKIREENTLEETYQNLSNTIEILFLANWQNIIEKKLPIKRQNDLGSYHRSADKEKFKDILKDGWKTKVKDLLGKANF